MYGNIIFGGNCVTLSPLTNDIKLNIFKQADKLFLKHAHDEHNLGCIEDDKLL